MAWWQQEDRVDTLRAAWESGGIQAAREAFPAQNDEQIRGAARRYGIMKPKKPGYRKQDLTPWIEAALRREYRSGKRPDLKLLAHQLNVNRGWLKWQASKLGLSQRQPRPRWTDAENAILEEGINAGYSPATIRNRLKAAGYTRGVGAIIDHKELLGWNISREALSAHQVAEIFGVDDNVVLRWIERKWLPVKRGLGFYAEIHVGGPPPDPTRQHWAIRHNDLKKFMLKNPGAWDHRRVRKEILLDLLCGAHWATAHETKDREAAHG